MGEVDRPLSDRERLRIAQHVVGRLTDEQRRGLAQRVLIILFRQGHATIGHLEAAGISRADIDAAIHNKRVDDAA